MTWLYVETNFVLELALAQDQALHCSKLLEFIPLTTDVLASAFQFSADLDLSLQDSVVLASVLSHRRNENEAGVFVTSNSKDFDDPDVQRLLVDAGCALETSFGAAVGRFMN